MKAIERLSVVLLLSHTLFCVAADGNNLSGGSDESKRVVLDDFLEHYVLSTSSVVYTVKTTAQGSTLDGPFFVFNTNNVKVAEGCYRDGKFQGEFTFRHPNGELSSKQHYENGKLRGTVTHLGVNGEKLSTTHWVNGEKDGLEVYWNKHGKTDKRIEWKAGHLVSVELFVGGILQKRLIGEDAVEYSRQKMMEHEERTSVKVKGAVLEK